MIDLVPVGATDQLSWSETEVRSTRKSLLEQLRLVKAELSQRERRWNVALESAGTGVWDCDLANDTVVYSRMWKLMRGYGPDEVVESAAVEWLKRVHPDDRTRIESTILKQNTGEIRRNALEYRERHKDGHYIWISSLGAAVEWAADGTPTRLVGTDTDITKRKVAEQENLELSRRLDLALNVSKVGVFEANLVTGELIWDERTLDIYGVDRTEKVIHSSDWQRLVHPEDAPAILLIVARAVAEKGTYDIRFRIVTPRGETRTLMSRGKYVEDPNTAPRIVGANWDVSADVVMTQGLRLAKELAEARNVELDAARVRMEHQSLHDALTDLPNRRYLNGALERHFARHDRRLALLHLDLDGFKSVNDTIGHNGGDELLVQVARRASESAGPASLVARLDSDEFVVCIFGDNDEKTAVGLADRLRSDIAAPFIVGGQTVLLGCSIGIALAPSHGRTAVDAMTNADLALYRAKAKGGNASCVFVPQYRAQMQERHSTEAELRRAFEEDEFELHYQPQVELLQRKAVGAEALLRWRHPERGFLTPASFIEVLKQGPLADAVGSWVLRQASTDAARLDRAGLAVRMGVNLFSAQFRSGNLEGTVEAILAETSLRPDLLELEITENTILNDGGAILDTLGRLRKLGVGLAFDDYGTGYASLSMLKRYPLTRLKLDQSFVQQLEADRGDNAIVRAVLQLGEGFDLDVIAEGIETEQQAAILTALGCRHGQGYLLGKPMPIKSFSDLLAQNLRASMPTIVDFSARRSALRADEVGPDVAKLKVLCVDDEADILELATMSLELDPEMDVRWESSGSTALTTAALWQPDAILLDVMMPTMDGPRTLMHLRENSVTAGIPVIFITARSQPRHRRQYVEMGAIDVIPKPFNPMTLAKTVREMVAA